MSIPTATEIRTYLEGYNITISFLTDAWIEARRDNFIVPFVERIINRKVDSEESVTEYVSGNGKSILFLSAKNINSLVSIEYVTGSDDTVDSNIGLGSVRLIPESGILKSITNITEGGYNTLFSKGEKNIKIVYKVGSNSGDNELKEAITYLCAEQMLGFVGARTGGGSLTVQGFTRNFGDRGKYQDIRNDSKRQAMFILKKYTTSVVGR